MSNHQTPGKGYRGQVHLVSPAGDEVVEIQVPGRTKSYSGEIIHPGTTRSEWEPKKKRRQDRRFQRLLSAGWRVVSPEEAKKIGEEQKKDTSKVDGSQKTGDKSHGGNHASKEVKDSPNPAEGGKKPRGSRGGQKNRRRQTSKPKKKHLQVQNAGQNGSVGVYSPQPLWVSKEILEEAEASAELLAQLAGKSHLKVECGVRVDPERLLIALETGDNPLPALESPDERPKVKILVTPDCSGSTQNWNGLAQAWALHLAADPDVDVIYLENFNGTIWESYENQDLDQKGVEELLAKVDMVLYLGDMDGYDLCKSYAQQGCTVIGLDSYCASYANPKLATTRQGKGTMHWVRSVSAKIPETWSRAIELAVRT